MCEIEQCQWLFIFFVFTNANSGSSFGSTPNSKPAPPRPAPPWPSSPWIIGDEIRASDKTEPRGTLIKCDPVPSFPFKVLTNTVNNSLLPGWSPKLTISTLTFSFFNFFANFTKSGSSAVTGDPTNTTIRILWFFPWRCFNTSCNDKESRDARL